MTKIVVFFIAKSSILYSRNSYNRREIALTIPTGWKVEKPKLLKNLDNLLVYHYKKTSQVKREKNDTILYVTL